MLITTPLLTMRQLKRRMKKITRSVTSPTRVAPAPNQEDIVNVVALANDLAIDNPVGVCVDGQKVVIRLAQNAAGGHAITWGTAYLFGTDATAAGLPTEGSSWWEVTFRFHGATSKWRAVEQVRSIVPVTSDTTAPTLTAARITAAGTTVALDFSEAVTAGAGGFATFTATLSGGATTLEYAAGDGTNSIVMTSSRLLYQGETGVIGFAPAANSVTDLAGNALEALTALAMTNDSTLVPPAGTTGWVYSYPVGEMDASSPPSTDNYIYNQRIVADKTTTVNGLSVCLSYVNAGAGDVKISIISGDGATILGTATATPAVSEANVDVEAVLTPAVNVTASESYLIQYGFSSPSLGNIATGTADGPANSNATLFDAGGFAGIPFVPVTMSGHTKNRVGIHQQ